MLWLIVEVASLVAVVVAIVAAYLNPVGRPFIPGLVLIGAGIVVVTLVMLNAIPPGWESTARLLALVLAIPGLVMNERRWKAMRSSRGTPP